jgi:hypothetical protein
MALDKDRVIQEEKHIEEDMTSFGGNGSSASLR